MEKQPIYMVGEKKEKLAELACILKDYSLSPVQSLANALLLYKNKTSESLTRALSERRKDLQEKTEF